MGEIGTSVNVPSWPVTPDTNSTVEVDTVPGMSIGTIVRAATINDVSAIALRLEAALSGKWIDAAYYDNITVADAAAVAAGKTLMISTAITLPSGAITLSATLEFKRSGSIAKGAATSLTIAAPPVGNPMHQIFSGFAAGEVTFSTGKSCTIYPQWFGALGDNDHDDTVAIQLAITAAAVWHKLVKFIEGTYKVTDTLTIYSGSTIEGISKWAYPASYGPTRSSQISFQPTSLKDLFIVGNNPNIGSTPAFYTKISVSDLILLGNGDTNSQYGINIDTVIYSNFSNLTITNFKRPLRLYKTINNQFDNIFMTGTQACIRYSGGSATTDVWRKCTLFGSPVGIEIVGATVGIRFINCLFEQLDTYGVDVIKDTESMSFIDCYSEDVPYTAISTGNMFRVGLDGTTVSPENSLIVIGGKYAGRNAGTVGDWMSVDYSNGVIVSGVNISRYTNIFKGTANTKANGIVASGINGIGFTNVYSGPAGKLTGIVPSGPIDAVSYQAAYLGAINIAGIATTSSLIVTGGAISFPVTENPNADPNTLDDYDEYTAASAACTGAITTSVIWSLTKIGRCVTLKLPATVGTASALGYFTFGTVLPVKYRPSVNTYYLSAPIIDNNLNQATTGLILINSTTGAISIYKDNISSNFTNANTAGLVYSTSVVWQI